MQAIVVTFDQLATTALGCYGNEWIETPHFDRLASRGVVFDCHCAEHVGDATGMGFVTGRIPRDSSSCPYDIGSAWSVAAGIAGIELALFKEVDSLPWSTVLQKTSETRAVAGQDTEAKPDEIPFARLVQATRQLLVEPRASGPRILWLHSAGVPEPWFPPEGFATLYFDEYEERGCDMAAFNRDNWGRHPAVYAGYVSLLDHWLGELIAAAELAAHSEPTLLICAAARGVDWMKFDMEHSGTVVGDSMTSTSNPVVEEWANVSERSTLSTVWQSPSLSDAVVRTPLLLRRLNHTDFDSEFAGTRSNRLVGTVDLGATLEDFFQRPAAASLSDGRSLLQELSETHSARKTLCFTDGRGTRGIRTSHWCCLVKEGPSTKEHEISDEFEPRPQLFAKPEDIWQCNDVAGQRPEITATLVEHLNSALPVLKPAAPVTESVLIGPPLI